MEGHDGDGIAVVTQRIEVGNQRRLFQEGPQARRRLQLRVLADDVAQLQHILPPFLEPNVFFERSAVVGAVKHLIEEVLKWTLLSGCAQLGHQPRKPQQRRARSAPKRVRQLRIALLGRIQGQQRDQR